MHKISTAFDLLIDADQEEAQKRSASKDCEEPAFTHLTTQRSINKKKDHPVAQRNNALRYALPHNVNRSRPQEGWIDKGLRKMILLVSAQRNVFFLCTQIA